MAAAVRQISSFGENVGYMQRMLVAFCVEVLTSSRRNYIGNAVMLSVGITYTPVSDPS